jgi:transmembrane sensor
MAEKRNQKEADTSFAEANAWFFRLQAEDATDAEREGFARWLAENAQHASAWAEVQALFTALDAPGQAAYNALRTANTFPCGQEDKGRAWTDVWQLLRKRSLVRLAASVVTAFLLVVIAIQAPVYYDRLIADYTTGTGQRRTVTLTDGSAVELNTDTAIRVDFADGRRRVEVLRGEAYFVVKPDPERPFAVTQGQGETRVIGTRFSVARREGRTVVAVDKGQVDVAADTAAGKIVRLHPGQSADYDADGVSPVHTIDPIVAFAWRRGQLVFRQQPLSAVVADLNRYWRGYVVILDSAIADQVVSGIFEIDRQASVLDALRRLLGVHVTTVTPYLVLLH